MPDAIPVQVAESVVRMIETGRTRTVEPLSQEFEIERSYAEWELALEDNEHIRIDVAVVSTRIEIELGARGGLLLYTVPVDVAIRKKFQPQDQCDVTGRVLASSVDPLVLLTQEVFTLFTTLRFSSNEQRIVWKEDPKLLACPIHKHLRELRQFTSLMRLVFQATA